MNENTIKGKVTCLIDEIVGNILPAKEDMSVNEKLSIILSESLQALIFVTSIEDEFNIQFEDEQIDLEFFQDINSTIGKIQQQLAVQIFPAARHVLVTMDQEKSAFTEKYVLKSIPVLLEGGAKNWPAMKRWTLPYLREKFADTRQITERYINGVRETQEFTMREYIEYVETTSDEVPFYLCNCQTHLHTEMTDHYYVPAFGSCWYKNFTTEKEKYELSWLFIGAANTRSVLHIDRWQTSAWNAVISGLKLWVFYDPGQSGYLYGGKPDPFAPDYYRYPEFSHADPLICLQRPGDIVFTPGGWWHAVMNIKQGISVTENFINETNYSQVLDFFERHDLPNSVATLKMIVSEHSDLPHIY